MSATSILLLGVLFFILLVMIRSLRFDRGNVTTFELERTAENGDSAAQQILKRQHVLPDILALKRVFETILMVLVTVCFVSSLGILKGIFLSVIALLMIGRLARFGFIYTRAQNVYQKYEPFVIRAARSLSWFLQYFASGSLDVQQNFQLHSKEELLHLVEQAENSLSHDQRLLLASAMKFEHRLVSEIMTPKSVVETINKSEVLGPIVLDKLHKTGHSRFPVINKDFDHVVGLLYTHDLIVGSRQLNNATAEKAMDSKVFYINEDQPLSSALAGFLRVHHHLFIVVNEYEETTGIITLEDTIEALIGRRIVDEFDQYEDLRLVASRAAAGRHKSDSSTHIKD